MKLLVVSHEAFPTLGGVATYTNELSRALENLGVELTLLVPERSAARDSFFLTSAPAQFKRLVGSGKGRAFPSRPSESETRPDVVLFTAWPTATLIGLLSSFSGRGQSSLPPLAIAAHGRELLLRPWSALPAAQHAYDRVRRRILRSSSHLFPVSHYTRGLLMELGAEPERCTVVPNGTDTDRFRPTASDALRHELGIGSAKVLFTLSRLVSRKGVARVLSALPAVRQAVPDVVYLVAGDGPELSELQNRARDLGLLSSGAVRFLGRVQDADLPVLYSLADLFVLPASSEPPDVEGFGIVYLEAAACGTPSVGPNQGGAAEAVVHGETGLQVDPADVDAIARACIELFSDDARRRAMGAHAKERVLREFSWSHSAERMLRVLERLSAGQTGNERT